MDIKLSPAQAQLREDVCAWLASSFPFDRRKEWAGGSAFREGLAANGLLTAVLPDPDDIVESTIRAAIVAEAAGSAVICATFFRATHAAANILMECGRRDMMDAFREGQDFAVAVLEPGRRFSLAPADTLASAAGSVWVLSGRKAAVIAGAEAHQLLVTARRENETALFLVPNVQKGISATRYRTIDGLAAADLVLDGAEGHLVAHGSDAEAALEHGLHRTFFAIGAEALGACDAAIDASAAYAGERQQFGRPISRFQVIAHRLARMAIEVDTLRGGVLNALSVADADAGARAAAARGLKYLIGESGRYVVQQAIQVHGGVGVLEDRRVAHCYKLLTSIDAYFGPSHEHLGHYADAMDRAG